MKHDIACLDTRMYSVSTVKSLDQEYLGLNMQINGGNCYGDSGGAGYYKDASGELTIGGFVSRGDTNCISTVKKVRIDVGVNYNFVQYIVDSADDGVFDICIF